MDKSKYVIHTNLYVFLVQQLQVKTVRHSPFKSARTDARFEKRKDECAEFRELNTEDLTTLLSVTSDGFKSSKLFIYLNVYHFSESKWRPPTRESPFTSIRYMEALTVN